MARIVRPLSPDRQGCMLRIADFYYLIAMSVNAKFSLLPLQRPNRSRERLKGRSVQLPCGSTDRQEIDQQTILVCGQNTLFHHILSVIPAFQTPSTGCRPKSQLSSFPHEIVRSVQDAYCFA